MFDIQSHWYRNSLTFLTFLLVPFSWLFGGIVFLRRFFYFKKNKSLQQFSVPIIVVGNITVGGTGKTPFVIELARFLRDQGFHPGIVSRGVGGESFNLPKIVDANATTETVGDEAILLKRQTKSPVVVGIDRVRAVQTLLTHFPECTVVISDDGLQHYRLKRDIEMVIVDGQRGFGNGHLIPAGPLREPISRLGEIDFIIRNGGDTLPHKITSSLMQLKGDELISLADPNQRFSLKNFPHKKIHAFAAIGHPQRFFDALRQVGFDVIEHIFPDHYHYQLSDFRVDDDLPILMTEKDAVKCEKFAKNNFWVLPVKAEIEVQLGKALLKKLLTKEPQCALS